MPPKRTHDNVDVDDEGDEGAEVKTIWLLNSNSEKGGKVMCELCSSILKSKVSLAIHMKSIHGDRYAQVFANKGYFSHIYPMDSKSKAGNALRLFCQEFGVPEKLVFDGSKEQNGRGTEFMKQIRQHDIDYHVSEPNLHNQNPVEGCIRGD